MSKIIGLLLALLATRCAFSQPYELSYSSDTGNLYLEIPGELPPIVAMQFLSENSSFVGPRPDVLTGIFDVYRPSKLFRFDTRGFSNTDFGPIFPTGMTSEALVKDICLDGAKLGGGSIAGTLNGLPIRETCDDSRVDTTQRPKTDPRTIDADARFRLNYDAGTGQLTVTTDETLPNLKSLRIASKQGVFQGTRPDLLDGELDKFNPELMRVFGSFDSTIDFGPAIQTNLDATTLAADLCVSGSVNVLGGPMDAPRFTLNNLPITACSQSIPLDLQYQQSTGDLAIGRHDRLISNLEITSASGLFNPAAASIQGLDGIDSFSSNSISASYKQGFSLPEVLPVGLTESELVADLKVSGVFLSGTPIDEMNLFVGKSAPAPPFEFDTLIEPPGNALTEEFRVGAEETIFGATYTSYPPQLKDAEVVPMDRMGGNEVLRINDSAVMFIGIPDDHEGPFSWMESPEDLGFPGNFFDVGESLTMDNWFETGSEKVFNLWGTLVPRGEYEIDTSELSSAMLVVVTHPIPLPEPQSHIPFCGLTLAFIRRRLSAPRRW